MVSDSITKLIVGTLLSINIVFSIKILTFYKTSWFEFSWLTHCDSFSQGPGVVKMIFWPLWQLLNKVCQVQIPSRLPEYATFSPHISNSVSGSLTLLCSTQVLVDGPCSGVRRQVVNLKNVHITKLRVRIPHTASTAAVREQWEVRHIDSTWEATRWCKNLRAKQRTAELTDFERFKLWKLRKARTAIIRDAYSKIKREVRAKGCVYLILGVWFMWGCGLGNSWWTFCVWDLELWNSVLFCSFHVRVLAVWELLLKACGIKSSMSDLYSFKHGFYFGHIALWTQWKCCAQYSKMGKHLGSGWSINRSYFLW